MVLIPKVVLAIYKYRPIVHGNFIFKIITIILTDRFNIVADKIVQPQQFGFIRRLKIHDCIAIAPESVNCLDRSKKSKNMAI